MRVEKIGKSENAPVIRYDGRYASWTPKIAAAVAVFRDLDKSGTENRMRRYAKTRGISPAAFIREYYRQHGAACRRERMRINCEKRRPDIFGCRVCYGPLFSSRIITKDGGAYCGRCGHACTAGDVLRAKRSAEFCRWKKLHSYVSDNYNREYRNRFPFNK